MNFDDLMRPDYQVRGLNRILPAIASQFGIAGQKDTLGLPRASRYVVVMVDGLGWRQLLANPGVATHLDQLAENSEPISCGVPSTTSASLTSLGTGQEPGQHGIVGYRFRNPENGKCMNALSWAKGPNDVGQFQPFPTWFHQMAKAGVGTANVALQKFNGSALTQCAMHGADFHGYSEDEEQDLSAKIRLTVEATHTAQVVYLYERMLDAVGHASGAGSWQWLQQLAVVDDLVLGLREALADDVCLIITGDHGMVNVDPAKSIIMEDYPEIGGWDIFAGEARFRHLYTERPVELQKQLADFLGDRAWVFTREEGMEQGLFGPVREDVAPRLGDVMVAMRDRWVMLTRNYPVELGMAGVHGSLTPDEMLVPLLVDGPLIN